MENSLHISRVELSGYKSIKNVDISFEPGLNIIIGKNAVGKTNFLNFLYSCLELDFDELGSFKSTLTFKNGNNFKLLKSQREYRPIKNKKDIEKDVVETHLINYNKYNKIVESNELSQSGLLFNTAIISHGTIKNLPIIEEAFNFKIYDTDYLDDLRMEYDKINHSNLSGNLLLDLLIKISELQNNKIINNVNLNETILKEAIQAVFENTLGYIKPILNSYTPIENLRLKSSFNIFTNENETQFSINNLVLEFKILNNWLSYSDLSDGTKRLFYIITECFEVEELIFSSDAIGTYPKSHSIILLEEPELGIHPHQYMKLLDFLKEQSRNKQIIITTHSPQTIDILEAEELNKIILAYTQEDGSTGLRHLGENEISKAQAYLEKSYLSDYWLYSDLEK